MFHHFHDNKKYLKSQGSINQNQLLKIIKYIGRDNILNADEFCEKLNVNMILHYQYYKTIRLGLSFSCIHQF